MPFHYLYSNQHFSSLSKHDKNRVFSHIRVEDMYETYYQKIWNFAEEFGTHVEDSFFVGISQNLRFKTFLD